MSRSVSNSDLKENVLKILEMVRCLIEGINIEACRISKKYKSEIFLPKELPKNTLRKENAEKIGHETNLFSREQSSIFESKLAYNLSCVMIKSERSTYL